MKYVLQFLIIIGFSFVGEVLARVVPLPVPASIWGIVLLFAALEMRLVRVVHIREVSDFLLTIMPIRGAHPGLGQGQSAHARVRPHHRGHHLRGHGRGGMGHTESAASIVLRALEFQLVKLVQQPTI